MTLVDSKDSHESSPTPIHLVEQASFAQWREQLSDSQNQWLDRHQFLAKSGQWCWLTEGDSEASVLVGVGEANRDNLSTLGHLPIALPEGSYRLEQEVADIVLLGWVLGAYQFTRYKTPDRAPAQLVVEGEQLARVLRQADATYLARDLINTGSDDMLPSHLAAAAEEVAGAFGAEVAITEGQALLDAGHRTIHAVGRAATDAPRLIDLTWGDPSHPKVSIIGKGVCFDSGGLDIKPAAGMRWMKKDMGGAAIALGLAQLIMANALPVRLRLLIPAVENAIAGNAYRPGDVIRTYQGTTVEIDNTDAEGRLVMCDALALAALEEPELLFDFATLTGSARSAVGAEIAAMFATDTSVARAIYDSGLEEDDAVWHMPLHQPYEHMLQSKVADTVNSAASPYGGSITAALFLQKFVGTCTWVHFDLMAFNTRARPGRPEGGEAMALRATYHYLRKRYADA